MNKRFTDVLKFLISSREVRNQQDFCDIMGLATSYVARLKSGDRPISESIISQIGANFPQINGDWLLTGEGEMLKREESKSNQQAGTNISYNADETIRELLELNKRKDEQISKLIDFITSQENK